MAHPFPPLWDDARIPDRYRTMSCQELIEEYQKTQDATIVLYLIAQNDGPQRRLSAILYNILGSYHKVEDFFQSLFLFLCAKLREVDPIRNCVAWFTRVVKNRALNEWRREMRRPSIEEGAASPSSVASLGQEEMLARQMDAKKRLLDLEAAVGGIEMGWQCICLKWFGKSYTECARELDITFTQFRGRYQRAHALLCDKFGEDYEKYLDWSKMEAH